MMGVAISSLNGLATPTVGYDPFMVEDPMQASETLTVTIKMIKGR